MKLIREKKLVLRQERDMSGLWSSMGIRERKGIFAGNYAYTANSTSIDPQALTGRFLSNSELWYVYKKVPEVRASIDSIVRRVATHDWACVTKTHPTDEAFISSSQEADRLTTFLQTPNKDSTTWQELLTILLTDLLIYDQAALEIVRDSKGDIQELNALKGSTIYPIIDEHGRILKYEQRMWGESSFSTFVASESSEVISFEKDQIIYFRLFPTTNSPLGNPLMESLVTEIITLMRSSEHLMMAMDADEIPAGILVLAGIGGQAADKAAADLRQLKGQDHKIRVLTTPDPQGVGARWVAMKRTPKDLEMLAVIDQVRRTVWRVFGVYPVEMGATDGVPRSTAEVQMDAGSSHLVTPILELVQAKLNNALVPHLTDNKTVLFSFDRSAKHTPGQALDVANKHKIYVASGLMTRNEVRAELGLLPVDGGDDVTIDTPAGLVPIRGGPPTQAMDVVKTDTESIDGKNRVDVVKHYIHDPREIIDRELGSPMHVVIPKQWNSGHFAKARTMPLSFIGSTIKDYYTSVQGLMMSTAGEIVGALDNINASGLATGKEDKTKEMMDEVVDRMIVSWKEVTRDYYEQVVEKVVSRVEVWTGQEIDKSGIADAYMQAQFYYLDRDGGFKDTMKNKLRFITEEYYSTRAIESLIEMGALVLAVFGNLQARMGLYAGALYGMANDTMTDTLIKEGTFGDNKTPTMWYGEWVSLEDERTCPSCTAEGMQPVRPLAGISIRPASGTRCMSNCRCVLVLWTQQEVQGGGYESYKL